MAIKHSLELVNKCREMRLAGERVKDISRETGIPVGTVYQIISGVLRDGERIVRDYRYGSRCWSKTQLDFVRSNAGRIPSREIAAAVDHPVTSVRTLASREGLSLRATIDPHDEWLCCELFKEGLTMKTIAEKMELTPYQVSKIIKSRGLR
ncbi:hypothetical protein K2652_002319 [Salmonella enterica subsp. enterica serovar Agbeni]|nr:hypothetical protein [Salmonella enterica subsp. enterica serovar Agbeni]EHW4351852.1 hypothetical protein [Salmonella enterica subsp. enterica serovar Agbeni]